MADASPDIKGIFLKALDEPSAVARAAYLAEACRDHPGALERVEALLGALEKAGSFLEVPALALEGNASTGDGSDGPPPTVAPTDAIQPPDEGEATPADRPMEATAPFDTSATGPPPSIPPNPIAEGPGTRIGPYKLLQRIGEGGMGVVYMAEQEQPVRRRVALKVIKPGMDTAQVVARFEAERQALALMDHPNIARVLDAGATASGRPYFVMELVAGVPITEYCDRERLTPRERLELFVPACRAIQHAHQKGVIHRDVKPSNVLVTVVDGRPAPKVIDFGVAKAVEQRLTERTLFTQFGSIVGTLEYMSPEQAEMGGLDVDTRSDVYSLGVLLYELLTGSTPLERARLREAGYAEILRRIREEEPPTPSTRLSGSGEALPLIAASRHTDSARLARLVRGELDWIAMRALEKDRTRRYDSAGSLAADVERYLADEAVEACPPSRRYRLGKFARKNRTALLAASLVLLALVAGIAGTTWGLFEARSSAEREGQAKLDADAKRRDAVANLAFATKGNDILGSIFQGLDPKAKYETVAELRDALRDNLDRAVKELDGSAIGDPLIVASMQDRLGESLLGLGESGKAIEILRKSAETRKARLGPGHPDTLRSVSNLADAYEKSGDAGLSLPLREEVFRLRRARLGPGHRETIAGLNAVATAYFEVGKKDLALPLHEQAVKTAKASLGLDHPDTAGYMSDLARAYKEAGRWKLAVPILEEAVGLLKVRLGPEHFDTLKAMNELADSYRLNGRPELGPPLLEETLKVRKAKLGLNHPATLEGIEELAFAYLDADKPEMALPQYEEALRLRKAKYGTDHEATFGNTMRLAHAYLRARREDQARPLLEWAMKWAKSRLEPDQPVRVAGLSNLAEAYFWAGKMDESLPLIEESLKSLKARLGPDHPDTLTSMQNLAYHFYVVDRMDLCIPLLEEVLRLRKARPGTDPRDTLQTLELLFGAYQLTGKPDRALPILEEAVTLEKVEYGPDHFRTYSDMESLARYYWGAGKPDRALPLLEEVLAHAHAKLGPTHPFSQEAASTLQFYRNLVGVEDRYRAKLAELGPHHIDTLLARRDVAQLAMSRNRLGEAESALLEVLEGMRDRPPDDPILIFTAGLLERCLEVRKQFMPNAWQTYLAMSRFGGVLMRYKRYAEAEPLLLEGYKGMKRLVDTIPLRGATPMPPIHKPRWIEIEVDKIPLRGATQIPEALDRLIELSNKRNQPDEVKKWQAERSKYPETKPAEKP